MDKIKNPCVKRCKYNKNNVCVGCYRTKQEIVNWWKMTDKEKLSILKSLKSREL